MFTFEQGIKAGTIRSVLYLKIIKETFEALKKEPITRRHLKVFLKEVQSVIQT